MMLIGYIIAFAWFSNLVAWRFDAVWWIYLKDKYLTHKILNCSACFGFWFSLALNIILLHQVSVSIMLALVISCISAIFERYLCVL